MDGKNNWFVKPDREADAHPHEVYDAESDRYYYKQRRKNKFDPRVEFDCDITPAMTEEYADIIRGIIRNKYPDITPVDADVPIAVRMSVYPAHFYPGGLQPYVVGESVVEWERWLYEALKGLVWATEKQICVTGTEIRHRDHDGIKVGIYTIYEQVKKKDNER